MSIHDLLAKFDAKDLIILAFVTSKVIFWLAEIWRLTAKPLIYEEAAEIINNAGETQEVK